MRVGRALVFTARPGSAALTEARLEAALTAVPGDCLLDVRWLNPTEAADVLFHTDDGDDLTPVLTTAEAAVAGLPIDVNIVADDIATRRKQLLVADMESTIIEQEMLDELADFVGLRERIADITERAMRGELDFESAIIERVSLLAGLPEKVIADVSHRITLMPGAATLVATMKAQGAYCALVSGGFTCFTGPIAARLGFDSHQANTLLIDAGRLSGDIGRPILGREAKLAALHRLATEREIAAPLTLAVGDGANDLAMLGAAGLGVAFRAKPKVREAARQFAGGAVITHGDLTALLYLQGYRANEIVAA